MTVVVTVNVEARYRGFLASVMLEIAPGVYTSPQMNVGIRERIWDVLTRWHYELGQGAIVMTWRDPAAVGEQRIRTLGEAPKDIVDADGVVPRKAPLALRRHDRSQNPVLDPKGFPRTRGDRPVG